MEKSVLYAGMQILSAINAYLISCLKGEIEFNADQQIVRWCNLSGTYKCSEDMAYQAGLPIDKFYSVDESCDESTGGSDSAIHFEKALEYSEEEFSETEAEWHKYHKDWLAKDGHANQCYKKLCSMIAQRKHAIERYGYLSQIEGQKNFDEMEDY